MTSDDESYFPDEEVVRRRDETVRRALNTPPQPKHRKVKESKTAKAAVKDDKSAQ
jgi:hypothetical protein